MWLIESLLAMMAINQHQQEKKSVNVTINRNFLGKVGKNDTQVDCKRVVVVSENWGKVTKRWNEMGREHKRWKEHAVGWGEKTVKT
jgi:hypothetical protein